MSILLQKPSDRIYRPAWVLILEVDYPSPLAVPAWGLKHSPSNRVAGTVSRAIITWFAEGSRVKDHGERYIRCCISNGFANMLADVIVIRASTKLSAPPGTPNIAVVTSGTTLVVVYHVGTKDIFETTRRPKIVPRPMLNTMMPGNRDQLFQKVNAMRYNREGNSGCAVQC